MNCKYAKKESRANFALLSLFSLQIVVFFEFCRVGDLRKLTALCSLCFDEVLQKLFGEYAADGQVVVIGFQSIQSCIQRGGKTLQLCLLLFGERVQVYIVGTPAVGVRIDLILDTVKACHKKGRIAEVGVQVASGLRISKRRSSGVLAYAGIRMTALRFEVA